MTDHPLSLTAEDVELEAAELQLQIAKLRLYVAAKQDAGWQVPDHAAVLRFLEAHELLRRQVAALLKKIRALERPFSFNEGRRPDWERSWTCDWCNAGWADTPNAAHPDNDCLWVQAHAPDVLAEAARLGLGVE